MLRIFCALIILALFASTSFAAVNQIEEVDGTPSKFPWKIKFDNGTLTDNLDGTMTHSIDGYAVAIYYKLDGSNTNGYFYLDTNKYLKKIDANTVGLYVNSVLIQDWQVIPAGGGAGVYMGFGGVTYSS